MPKRLGKAEGGGTSAKAWRDSSQGKATVQPAPRSTARRETGNANFLADMLVHLSRGRGARAKAGCGKTRCWVGPGFSPDTHPQKPIGLQALRYAFLPRHRKLEEIHTPGPKGQRTRPVDVRAKARTYPGAGFSAAYKALVICGFYGPTEVVP
jgi:hypothetical protein